MTWIIKIKKIDMAIHQKLFARFMVEETFGVYGKENRPRLARGFGCTTSFIHDIHKSNVWDYYIVC